MKKVKKYLHCVVCGKPLGKGFYKYCSLECKQKARKEFLQKYYQLNKEAFHRRRRINRQKQRYLKNQARLQINNKLSEHYKHLNRFGATEFDKPYEE